MSDYKPKLDVFKIEVNPMVKAEGNTFKDVFYALALIEVKNRNRYNQNSLFKKYYENFIKKIDQEAYYLKNKKGLTAYDTKDKHNPSIKTLNNQEIIYGIIEGGDYGKERNTSKITDKKIKNPLKEDNIVTDRFFFLLYTPSSSQYGVLMILSYSIASVTPLFVDFLKNLFYIEGLFKKPIIDRFVSEKIKEQYKDSYVLNCIKFETVMPAQNFGDKSFTINDGDLIIEVRVRPKEPIRKERISSFINSIKNTKIGRNVLDLFDKRNIIVKDQQGQPQTFSIDQELDPTPKVYLEDKLKLNSQGIPNFDDLLNYSISLLDEIKPQIYPIENVEER